MSGAVASVVANQDVRAWTDLRRAQQARRRENETRRRGGLARADLWDHRTSPARGRRTVTKQDPSEHAEFRRADETATRVVKEKLAWKPIRNTGSVTWCQ